MSRLQARQSVVQAQGAGHKEPGIVQPPDISTIGELPCRTMLAPTPDTHAQSGQCDDLQLGTVIAFDCMKGDRSNGRDTSRIPLKWRDAGEDLETTRRLDTYDPARTRNGNERVA